MQAAISPDKHIDNMPQRREVEHVTRRERGGSELRMRGKWSKTNRKSDFAVREEQAVKDGGTEKLVRCNLHRRRNDAMDVQIDGTG